ncbi:methylmalonyl Co-A mutase-associated GTPase MeaB [Planctomycetota bacterium]
MRGLSLPPTSARLSLRAIARAITWIENGEPEARGLLDAVYRKLGHAYRVGITGPPGGGKSTLTAAMTRLLRERSRTVGIVAVDPTSPFSGGALLGDRVRMSTVATDPGVFIRSMAARGSLGGLAHTTGEVSDLLDATGFDLVLIETVGVGQSEVDIAEAADTTLVVLSPEAGDAVQAMKAGLMEIADIFVVNKADRDGAEKMMRTIRAMLELGPKGDWDPPVLLTQAQRGDGVREILEALSRHRSHLETQGLLESRRRDRVEARLRGLVQERLWVLFRDTLGEASPLARWTARVAAGEAAPYRAVEAMIADLVDHLSGPRLTDDPPS